MTDQQLDTINSHLYPGDGKEAVAMLICGTRIGKIRHRLTVHEIVKVPYEACTRTESSVDWKIESIVDKLEKAIDSGFCVIKAHSHPTSYPNFSPTDDQSDRDLLSTLRSWQDDDEYLGSIVILPNETIFGQVLPPGSKEFVNIDNVSVAGSIFQFMCSPGPKKETTNQTGASHRQAFGDMTFEKMSNLCVCVVGCSGTGSPVIEQLARLGVGEIILIDDDHVEAKNLNRIVNATEEDATENKPKVHVLADAIKRMGTGVAVHTLKSNLAAPDAIKLAAQADVIFGCVDSHEGRFVMNCISTYYSIPYIDTGVLLEADGLGGIKDISGKINYVIPGGSSLLSRGLISMERVKEEGLKRTNPEMYEQQKGEGYILGSDQPRPAVISVNFFAAAMAVLELLNRIHPYRYETPNFYNESTFTLTDLEIHNESCTEPCMAFFKMVGRGDTIPLLGQPQFQE